MRKNDIWKGTLEAKKYREIIATHIKEPILRANLLKLLNEKKLPHDICIKLININYYSFDLQMKEFKLSFDLGKSRKDNLVYNKTYSLFKW